MTNPWLDIPEADYVGHMLHLAAGERTSDAYAGWIRSYREANPVNWPQPV